MGDGPFTGSLFPGWEAPDRVAAFVVGRALVDAALVVAVVLAVGAQTWQFPAVLALAAAATGLSYVVLGGRTSEARAVDAGRVELALRTAELGLCGLLALGGATPVATAAFAVLGVAVALLTLLSFPLYGEATVAP